MIEVDSRKIDPADTVTLISAVAIYAALNDERLDTSMIQVGLSKLFHRCQSAAAMIASSHKAEGDSWDGAWWYDRLMDLTDSGIAAKILTINCDVEELQPHRSNAAPMRKMVRQWLMDIGNCDEGTWDLTGNGKKVPRRSEHGSKKILPCPCGYEGGVEVKGDGFWLEAVCPSCTRKVQAFTAEGIIEAWNKPAEVSQQ